ncbi:MAG TPA: helicase [Candidatus Tectomicrobia bacterium]
MSHEAQTESSYEEFLATKLTYAASEGLSTYTLPDRLFPFQRQVTAWALERGRAALFLDTGLGKSCCQLASAHNVAQQAGDVLILAPLAVAQQTVDEGATMDIPVTLCRTKADVRSGINITNYERLHLFDAERFAGIVLDESSCLKAFDGKTRTQLIETFRQTPYRLCCTATPSPNDYMELGNHAEFLGVMSRTEMLATFFCHDGGNTSQWRLKRHAEEPFWRWVASWAVALTHPRMLGDTTPGYDLPPLVKIPHVLTIEVASNGLSLFPMEAQSLTEQRQAKRAGLETRVAQVVATVNAEPDEPWVIWAELNDEQDALAKAFGSRAFSVSGSDTLERKEATILGWLRGDRPIMISKASIMGWGLNFQRCARMAFVGINNSFESWYQAVRRCWRFGQRREVQVHYFYLDIEAGIVRNLARKEADAATMHNKMTSAVLSHIDWKQPVQPYTPTQPMIVPAWVCSQPEGASYVASA